MSQKIIFPEGKELLDYLNRGYAICNDCGALMEFKEDPLGSCGTYVCPSCGCEVDNMEYEYESGDEDDDSPPACCSACGGPYPSCMTSCKIFDD